MDYTSQFIKVLVCLALLQNEFHSNGFSVSWKAIIWSGSVLADEFNSVTYSGQGYLSMIIYDDEIARV